MDRQPLCSAMMYEVACHAHGSEVQEVAIGAVSLFEPCWRDKSSTCGPLDRPEREGCAPRQEGNIDHATAGGANPDTHLMSISGV